MGERSHPQARPGMRKGLHKDWRTWVAVLAMLAAISVYVLTLDDSVEPVEVSPPAAAP